MARKTLEDRLEHWWHPSLKGNPRTVRPLDGIEVSCTVYPDKRTGQFRYVISETDDSPTPENEKLKPLFSKECYRTAEAAKVAVEERLQEIDAAIAKMKANKEPVPPAPEKKSYEMTLLAGC